MFDNKIELTEQIISEIVNNFYDLGEVLSSSPLESGHESDNVKFSTAKGDYVLKLLYYPTRDQVQEKMVVHELLHTYGVKLPIPIKTKIDDYVVPFDEHNILVVHTFIPGEPIYREDSETMYNWMSWFGKQFGIFHKKSKEIPLDIIKQKVKDNSIYVLSNPPGKWVIDRYDERETLLPKHEKNTSVIKLFKEFLEKVDELDFTSLSTGFIHGDIMPGNFLKEGDELNGIIDFGSSFNYLIADVARWVMYTSLYKPEQKKDFRNFIVPYLEHSKIPIDELRTLPILLKSTGYVQFFYYAYRIHNNITQGLEEEELVNSEEYNWRGYNNGIKLVESATSIDYNYFYDLAVEAMRS